MKTNSRPMPRAEYGQALVDSIQPINTALQDVAAEFYRDACRDQGPDGEAKLALLSGTICQTMGSQIASFAILLGQMNARAQTKLATHLCSRVITDAMNIIAEVNKGTYVNATFTAINIETGKEVPFDFRDHMTGDENRNDSGRGDA